MKPFFYVIISFLLLSCISKKEEKQASHYVEVYYLKDGLMFPMNLGCGVFQGELMKEMVKYKKIEDEDFLKIFTYEFNNLKKSKEQNDIDVRIQVVYHNKTTIDTICMGENFDIQVNGVKKEDSKKLLNIIKEKIYDYKH